MEATSILSELAVEGCRFVVVGSTARMLIGETSVRPNDLDIVISPEAWNRRGVAAALARLGGRTPNGDSAWEWGFRTLTRAGPVDVVVRFVDGTTHCDHDARAVGVPIASGVVVRCSPTRHVP